LLAFHPFAVYSQLALARIIAVWSMGPMDMLPGHISRKLYRLILVHHLTRFVDESIGVLQALIHCNKCKPCKIDVSYSCFPNNRLNVNPLYIPVDFSDLKHFNRLNLLAASIYQQLAQNSSIYPMNSPVECQPLTTSAVN
jgi:hypothetical protein